jgi:hypothetical protein
MNARAILVFSFFGITFFDAATRWEKNFFIDIDNLKCKSRVRNSVLDILVERMAINRKQEVAAAASCRFFQ